MKLGISTACFYPLETEKAFELLCHNEIPVSEIFFNSAGETMLTFAGKIAGLSREYGTQITSIHHFRCVSEPFDIFSEYSRRFDESRSEFERFFEAGAMLGAKVAVFHGDRKISKITVEEYCERFSILDESAKKYGLRLSQENVNGFRSGQPEFIKQIRTYFKDAVFTFDNKQVFRAGTTEGKMLSAMSGAIVNAHICDRNENKDCMLPTAGKYDFNRLFFKLKNAGYDGTVLIEVYRDAYNEYSELFKSYHTLKNEAEINGVKL